MGEFLKSGLTVFGALIGLAIIAVIVSRKSNAPQAITAASSGIAKIVAAAVNPGTSSTNGNLGLNANTGAPSLPSLSDMWHTVPNFGG